MKGPLVLRGVSVALATVFDAEQRVDAASTAAHALRLVELGIAGVVVGGSTGEAPALSDAERSDLLRAVSEQVGGRVPVYAGTGGATAADAAARTARARDDGADGVLVLSPLRSADPAPYYEQVRKAAGDLPVLAYHFPAMSPPGIAVDALGSLEIDGVKDSSGDAGRLLRTLQHFTGAVYLGSSALLVQGGAVGCAGAILAVANVAPDLAVKAWDGDGQAQRDLASDHFAVAEAWPRGMKRVMHERFGTSPVTRMG